MLYTTKLIDLEDILASLLLCSGLLMLAKDDAREKHSRLRPVSPLAGLFLRNQIHVPCRKRQRKPQSRRFRATRRIWVAASNRASALTYFQLFNDA